ncbi:MAG: phosphocholine-specific phospholipase C [Pseudomonadota bacterium]
MTDLSRRAMLRAAALGGGATMLPASIARALALPARRRSGGLEDVEHVVILTQGSRSLDHYFGSMRGIRGFGDRHPVPLPGGRTVWDQRDGDRIARPFHLNSAAGNAMNLPALPEDFAHQQAAWGQGRMDGWAARIGAYAMGHYRRADLPFHHALADAFTLSDAYHASVLSGSGPNRVALWSGSAQDPVGRARGIPGVAENSEANTLRTPPRDGMFQGNGLDWATVPEVLEAAGIDWAIYFAPEDNHQGMNGWFAFDAFRDAAPGSALYEKGRREHHLGEFRRAVVEDRLPAVTWVQSRRDYIERSFYSNPLRGAEYAQFVLSILTANPAVWAKTVFFLAFDQCGGYFDHVPPPAVPSYDAGGRLAGGATLDIRGDYFNDRDGKFLDPTDTISGKVRPWGLGPRVPLYIVSPWSKGGWVHSEVADHTSIGQFIEKRFGVTIPAISPWHRAVCSDLVSAFDFEGKGDAAFPDLPDASGASAVLLTHLQRPRVAPPQAPEPLFQEPGVRRSRALPYALDVTARPVAEGMRLEFANSGAAGAVFHVYDRLHLDGIPRRYTVEAGKRLDDVWALDGDAAYDLWVLGPNGFLRHFTGRGAPQIVVAAAFDAIRERVTLTLGNAAEVPVRWSLVDAYDSRAVAAKALAPGETRVLVVPLARHGGWYDLTVASGGQLVRLAGRVETGRDSISDPLMGAE